MIAGRYNDWDSIGGLLMSVLTTSFEVGANIYRKISSYAARKSFIHGVANHKPEIAFLFVIERSKGVFGGCTRFPPPIQYLTAMRRPVRADSSTAVATANDRIPSSAVVNGVPFPFAASLKWRT
jgi:hypothetical protein